MMSSKKIVNLQKKVREKINCIHEQKNILSAMVDSSVVEANEQAERLLAETESSQFMMHYLDVMKFLDQSYNSLVMLTAEAESLCENLDMSAAELLDKPIDVLEDQEDTSLKGATAAPYQKSASKKIETPVKEKPNTCSSATKETFKAPALPKFQKRSSKKESSSNSVKPETNSSRDVERKTNVENVNQNSTENYSLKNYHIDNLTENLDGDGQKQHTTGRDTKKKVTKQLSREYSNERPRLDTDVAARFLKGIINQAKKDNESSNDVGQATCQDRAVKPTHNKSPDVNQMELCQEDVTEDKGTWRFNESWRSESLSPEDKKYFPKTVSQLSSSEMGEAINKFPVSTLPETPSGMKEQQGESTGVKEKNAKDKLTSSSVKKPKHFPRKEENTETVFHEKSTTGMNITPAENVKNNSENIKAVQNDLTVACDKTSANSSSMPLEMNISSDNTKVTANNIGQMSLPVGRPTPAVVSETSSPWNFYVQIVNCALEKLMQDIGTFMSSEEKSDEVIEQVEEGMIYLAQYSQDHLYYRAKVTDICTQEYPQLVDVLYIDYGNAEKRSVQHLRKLPPQFATMPSQAIYCALAKIAPNNKYGVWTEQDILTFSQLTNSKKFFCTLIQPSRHPDIPNIVDLFFNSTLPGAWVPTPVFIQTILMNSNIGRMVSIQEQVNSFMIFFQLSPKSISSLSPTSQSNTNQNSTVELRGETTHITESSNSGVVERKTPYQQKSLDSNDNDSVDIVQTSGSSNNCCDAKESQIKTEESTVKDNSCDNDKASSVVEKKNIIEKEVQETATGGNAEGVTDQNSKANVTEGKERNYVISDKVTHDKVTVEEQTSELTENSDSSMEKDKLNNKEVKVGNKCEISCDTVIPETNEALNRKDRNNSEEVKVEEKTSVIPEQIDSSTKDKLCCDEIKVENKSDMSPSASDRSNNNLTETSTEKSEPVDLKPLPNLESIASFFSVMVSFIKSPSLFYVHIISEVTAKTLNVVCNTINSEFSQLSRKQLQKMSRSLSPKVNDICCAQFCEDNKYYRAQILEIQPPSSPTKGLENDSSSDSEGCGKAKVLYMDYGDVVWVPKRRLFPLPKDLKSIPPLAIKCSLAYVKPQVDDSWSKDGSKCFDTLTGAGQDKVLKMIIIEGSIEKNLESVDTEPLKVVLVDDTSSEEICINMDLIDQGFAVLDVKEDVLQKIGSVPDEKMGEWNPMMEDFFSNRNSYKVDVDDAGVATVGYKAQDEARICKYYNIGDCWRGDRCPYKHVHFSTDGVTQDQELVYGALDEYYMENILPEPGTWVAVEVTTILNPAHFYISLPFGKSAIDDLKEKEASDKKESDKWQMNFEELIAEMQEEYNKVNYQEDHTIDKAPGEIVAAQYKADGKWYRARVLIVEEKRMRVFFVDFGNKEWIGMNSIRTILPDFLHVPFQALECFLLGIEPLDVKFSYESKKRFKELVDGKILVAFVKSRSYSGVVWIDLYDTTGNEDVDIAKLLTLEKLVQDTGSTTTSSKMSHCSSDASLILVPG